MRGEVHQKPTRHTSGPLRSLRIEDSQDPVTSTMVLNGQAWQLTEEPGNVSVKTHLLSSDQCLRGSFDPLHTVNNTQWDVLRVLWGFKHSVKNSRQTYKFTIYMSTSALLTLHVVFGRAT